MSPHLRSPRPRRAAAASLLAGFAVLGCLGLLPAQARPAGPMALADTGARPLAPQAPQQVSLIPSACRVDVAESIAPEQPRLCDEGEVAVSLGITCPTSLPVHLVIAVDRSKSIADPPTNPFLRDIQQSARQVLDVIDFDADPENKAGVLSHGFRVTVETELTNDPGRASGGVSAVRYQAADLGEDPAKAIDKAMQLLRDARTPAISPIEVILLYGDGCDPSVGGCPAASKAAASRAAGEGVAVMTVCYAESPRETCKNTYKQMASDPSYYFESRSAGVPKALKQLLDQGKGLYLKQLNLLEVLGPQINYVAGSGTPLPTALPPRLTFGFKDAKVATPQVAGYRIKPAQLGSLALRSGESAVSFVDSFGRSRAGITVPLRSLNVEPCIEASPTPEASATPAASATPTDPPTATASPSPQATPLPSLTFTPTASATAQTRRVYLPLLLRQACKPAVSNRNYVILVLDASSSMEESSGAQTKIAAAKAAALAFVDLLKPGVDAVGLVPFNSQAAPFEQGSVWPGEDFGPTRAAIAGIRTAPGTRIDLALARVQEILREMRSSLGAYDNVLTVLMTDGRPDQGTVPAILESAAAIKGAGMRLYTVGLGADIDRDLLRQVASGPGYYLEAPSGDDLEALYRSLAVNVGCPGGSMWGQGGGGIVR